MAKVTVTRACGHAEQIGVFGNQRNREYRIRSEERRECSDCYRARRLAEGRQAAEAAEQAGLPTLVGTERQIAWAASIREQKLAEVETYVRDAEQQVTAAIQASEDGAAADQLRAGLSQIREYAAVVRAQTRASYWIDNRDQTASLLIAAVHRQRQATAK